MPTEAKRETVGELRDEFARSTTLIVSSYRGLRVGEIGEIRRSLRRHGVSYRVVKNRLMQIAADGPRGEALGGLLHGPTAIAFASGDEAGAARAVIDALRPFSRVVSIRGAVLGTRAYEADDVTRLATLPTREVLLAEIAGAVAAPMAGVAGLFDAPLREMAGGIGALIDARSAA